MKSGFKLKVVSAIFLLSIVIATSSSAQTFNTLFNFSNAIGGNPDSTLVQGIDGNLYGTTASGGPRGHGVVFKMTSAGVVSIVHYFSGPDGSKPIGLVLGVDGNLYGVTQGGGASSTSCPQSSFGCGTFFEITSRGTLATLHSFNGSDGFWPVSAPVQARDGSFYGTTQYGGTALIPNGAGVIYKIDVHKNFSVVHNFGNETDGEYPSAPLVVGDDGNLYGTAQNSSLKNGNVFTITPSGAFTTLHSFNGKDGQDPVEALVQAGDQKFYGAAGGGVQNEGTVFWISPGGHEFRSIRSFNGLGGTAGASLLLGADGNFYGPLGTGPYGGLFEITPIGTVTTLHTFNGTDGGVFPTLMQATNGTFYGTTAWYGANNNCPSPATGCGTAFSLSTGLGPYIATVPTYGWVGRNVTILGYNLTGATSVTFNGTPSAFTVVSDTEIKTTVPAGATNGVVSVTTPSGTLATKVIFQLP